MKMFPYLRMTSIYFKSNHFVSKKERIGLKLIILWEWEKYLTKKMPQPHLVGIIQLPDRAGFLQMLPLFMEGLHDSVFSLGI